MNRLRFCCLLAALLGAALASPALAAPGPTSTLYIMNYLELGDGSVTGLDLIQGISEVSNPTSFPLGIDIAVYGDVRTMGYSDTNQGEKFDLSGNFAVGGPYTNNIFDSQLHDGTSDGNYNYSVNYTTGDLLQFDRDWANPTTLFNVTADLPDAGWITMNASDGTFWLSQWGGGDLVAHFSPTGTLLGGFNSGVSPSSGLALDPADGTLWMADDSTKTLFQFDQAGNPLQSLSYAVNGQWYGMEFDTTPVPEPGSLALAALSLVGLVAWRVQRARTYSSRANSAR